MTRENNSHIVKVSFIHFIFGTYLFEILEFVFVLKVIIKIIFLALFVSIII